jgi:formylglycine-generating enzyme required for sulfatase activity
MVVVPAGSFLMGSPPSEKGREPADKGSEGPQHPVTIARPFAVGKFEVTFAEWDACVTGGGCTHSPKDFGSGRSKRPVINVSWNDITSQYLPWLNRKSGKTYRLLTEAEWEYAARAGTTTRFAFGETITRTQAQYSVGDSGSAGGPVEVGSFPANAFGLHDMHGNVWEWVQDCWNGSYNGAPSDGSAWISGAAWGWVTTACDSRILRGGSWFLQAENARSANRYGWAPGARNFDMGFRVARTLTDK